MSYVIRLVLLIFVIAPIAHSKISYEETWTTCSRSLKKAQKNAYLKTIRNKQFCRGPFIPLPLGKWTCQYEENLGRCNKNHISCTREYECRYSTAALNRQKLINRVRQGDTLQVSTKLEQPTNPVPTNQVPVIYEKLVF